MWRVARPGQPSRTLTVVATIKEPPRHCGVGAQVAIRVQQLEHAHLQVGRIVAPPSCTSRVRGHTHFYVATRQHKHGWSPATSRVHDVHVQGRGPRLGGDRVATWVCVGTVVVTGNIGGDPGDMCEGVARGERRLRVSVRQEGGEEEGTEHCGRSVGRLNKPYSVRCRCCVVFSLKTTWVTPRPSRM